MRMVLAVCAVIGTLAPWTIAFAETFPDTPNILICSSPSTGDRPAIKIILYLYAVTVDGERFYKSIGTPGVGATVSNEGKVATTLPDCDGLTLDVLRQNGQTADF